MAVNSLSPENYHMFQPDPIETSLANAASSSSPNAGAVANYIAAQADRNIRQRDYQSQMDTMHGIQQKQFAVTQDGLNFDRLLKAAHDLNSTPDAYNMLAGRHPNILPGVTDKFTRGVDNTRAVADYAKAAEGYDNFVKGGGYGAGVTALPSLVSKGQINQGPTPGETIAGMKDGKYGEVNIGLGNGNFGKIPLYAGETIPDGERRGLGLIAQSTGLSNAADVPSSNNAGSFVTSAKGKNLDAVLPRSQAPAAKPSPMFILQSERLLAAANLTPAARASIRRNPDPNKFDLKKMTAIGHDGKTVYDISGK